MNILKVIFGLLLPMVLAAQRPLGFLNVGSTTLSGNNNIVFKSRDHDEAYRVKLSRAPVFEGHGAGRSGDEGSCRRGQDKESCSGVRTVF